MQAIEKAMNEWSSLSCIRFVPRTDQESYIEFFKGKGCVYILTFSTFVMNKSIFSLDL